MSKLANDAFRHKAAITARATATIINIIAQDLLPFIPKIKGAQNGQQENNIHCLRNRG